MLLCCGTHCFSVKVYLLVRNQLSDVVQLKLPDGVYVLNIVYCMRLLSSHNIMILWHSRYPALVSRKCTFSFNNFICDCVTSKGVHIALQFYFYTKYLYKIDSNKVIRTDLSMVSPTPPRVRRMKLKRGLAAGSVNMSSRRPVTLADRPLCVCCW